MLVLKDKKLHEQLLEEKIESSYYELFLEAVGQNDLEIIQEYCSHDATGLLTEAYGQNPSVGQSRAARNRGAIARLGQSIRNRFSNPKQPQPQTQQQVQPPQQSQTSQPAVQNKSNNPIGFVERIVNYAKTPSVKHYFDKLKGTQFPNVPKPQFILHLKQADTVFQEILKQKDSKVKNTDLYALRMILAYYKNYVASNEETVDALNKRLQSYTVAPQQGQSATQQQTAQTAQNSQKKQPITQRPNYDKFISNIKNMFSTGDLKTKLEAAIKNAILPQQAVKEAKRKVNAKIRRVATKPQPTVTPEELKQQTYQNIISHLGGYIANLVNNLTQDKYNAYFSNSRMVTEAKIIPTDKLHLQIADGILKRNGYTEGLVSFFETSINRNIPKNSDSVINKETIKKSLQNLFNSFLAGNTQQDQTVQQASNYSQTPNNNPQNTEVWKISPDDTDFSKRGSNKQENLNYTSNLINRILQNPNVSPGDLETYIYQYYTTYPEQLQKWVAIQKDPTKFNESKNKYKQIKDKLISFAGSIGWIEGSNPNWQQFNKPQKTQIQNNGGNFKRYLTFQPDKYWENLQKLEKFMNFLNTANTIGKVSFKIGNSFSASYHHADSVVIHYNNQNDATAVDDAVKKTGFDLLDRKTLGRTDTGIDTPKQSDSKSQSDSQWKSKEAAKELVNRKQEILDLFKTNQQKATEIIKKVLDDKMFNLKTPPQQNQITEFKNKKIFNKLILANNI